MKSKVLEDVARGKLSAIDALNLLYGPKPKRASFIKLYMNIKDSKMVSGFVNALFFFPIPIVFGKYFIIKALKKAELPESIYTDLIGSLGGSTVSVKSKDATIKIKIL